MKQTPKFDRSVGLIRRIIFRCTSKPFPIISNYRATDCIFCNNLLLSPPAHSQIKTVFQKPNNGTKSSDISLLNHSSSYIIEKFYRSKLGILPLLVPYQNTSLIPWSALLIFSTIITIFTATLRNEKLQDQDQEIKRVSTEKISIPKFCENNKMTDETLPGRLQSLTSEQEVKLKEFWTHIFQVAGIFDETTTTVDKNDNISKQDTAGSKKPKKKRISLFRRNKEENEPEIVTSTNMIDDKFGQMKLFDEAMTNMTPESLKTAFWSMVKHDNPDSLLLRFLRARKWDVEKALVMMISTMRWRLTEVHVDDDIIKNGELKAFEQSNSTDAAEKKFGKDFLDQMRLGKSFLHGTDKKGRPMCLVRVRQHRQGEQSEESLERYTVYLIETARMVLTEPVDTASIIFDMTGFSMANMDYTPVKFMIKCFEANYPECLGIILVHKAPWVFQGIWKIIRGWLDPVVASKVQFTNTIEEMEEYINRSQILKEIGGDEDWEYKYIEPILGENDKMKDTDTRDRLLLERQKINKEFENATHEWIHASTTDSVAINEKRQKIVDSLRKNYWRLDPYLRARTYYDRIGVINAEGIISFYPSKTRAIEPENASTLDQS